MAARVVVDVVDNVFKKVAKIFKVKELREYQKDALKSLWEENDCFVCQPTGSGKSIIYQSYPFFSFLMDTALTTTVESFDDDVALLNVKRIILVISPLVGLMKDQVMYLQNIGISSISLRKDMEVEGAVVDIKV